MELTEGLSIVVTPINGTPYPAVVRGLHETGCTAWRDGTGATFADRDAAGVVTLILSGPEQNATVALA